MNIVPSLSSLSSKSRSISFPSSYFRHSSLQNRHLPFFFDKNRFRSLSFVDFFHFPAPSSFSSSAITIASNPKFKKASGFDDNEEIERSSLIGQRKN